ncbi:MAG: hypothetical protein PHX04_04895 [Bacilli bacterium]|nr:hypothetical protein [Bacilli bacterium]
MIRNFISIIDAKKVIFKDFSLLDKNLFIKKNNQNETVSIDPIISLGRYSKYDVDTIAYDCLSKGKELLFEINPDASFADVEIQTFQKLENGTYYKIDENFEPNIIQLIDFDVLAKTSFPKNAYNIVVILPSEADSESLFFSKNNSVIVLRNHFSKRRNELTELRLGCDLYIKPNDSAMYKEYPEYLVELEEHQKNIFRMIKKKHYFLKIFSEEEISYLSPETLKIYNKLINKVHPVKLPKSGDIKYMIRQSDLKLEMSFYEGLIEVYNQEGMDLVPVSLSQSKEMVNK